MNEDITNIRRYIHNHGDSVFLSLFSLLPL